MHQNSSTTPTLQPIGLMRHLIVIIYDVLLLCAVLIFAGWLVLPLTHAKNSAVYSFYLICVSFCYFAWQWRRGGTLAMQTWRVTIRTNDQQPLSWWRAWLRFSIAIISWLCLGLGFWWQLWDSQHRTWQDIVSNTQLFYLPKSSKTTNKT